MKLRDITIPVSSLRGIGESTAKIYANLNIRTVADLLSHWPRTWEDRTKYVPLSAFAQNAKVNTIVKVLAHDWFGYGKMKTLKIRVQDMTAQAELICFNRPFMAKSLPVGSLIQITGAFSFRYNSIQSSSFDAVLISTEGALEDTGLPEAEITPQDGAQICTGTKLSGGEVLPVYPLTAGITQAQLRKTIARALKEYGKGIDNEIPQEVIDRQQLLSKQDCIRAMHQPQTLEEAEKARKCLIFEELYLFQRTIGERSLLHRGRLPDDEAVLSSQYIAGVASDSGTTEEAAWADKAFETSLSPKQKVLFSRLPFALTQDQKRVIVEMNADIDNSYTENSAYSMARLLQGDVGSGKTLAAFFACLRVADYRGQSAILAPTELLARQHAENAAVLLEPAGIRLAFLTGNIKADGRSRLLAALKSGEIDIVIGTHALFSQNVQYKDLRLAVIDEQHRFGVLQRNAILEKGRRPLPLVAHTSGDAQSSNTEQRAYAVPNLLMMSATPIPQTLALSVFGDLDISTIRTMPAGRLPIKTHLTKQGSEQNVYSFIRSELAAGRQAYFVYPLIEQGADGETEGQTDTLKSAEEMFTFLSTEVFPEYKVALIHSRIDEENQRAIMQDFHSGAVNILVATSVVEVGVDVPNATCMVIEHAERFGLAALHQLRGRVGRGTMQSHCFLIYSKKLTDMGKERLKALFESTDGFFIAEQDLILRGPGEVLGVQQSGYLLFSIADPVRDRACMSIARTEAFNQLRKGLSKAE